MGYQWIWQTLQGVLKSDYVIEKRYFICDYNPVACYATVMFQHVIHGIKWQQMMANIACFVAQANVALHQLDYVIIAGNGTDLHPRY